MVPKVLSAEVMEAGHRCYYVVLVENTPEVDVQAAQRAGLDQRASHSFDLEKAGLPP